MPTMDGFATTQLIRQRMGTTRRVPIVALSAHDAVSYREKCLRAGMDDMLSKPCTLEACATVLRRWIANATAQPGRSAVTPPDQQAVPQAAAEGLSSIDAASVARLRSLRSGGSSDLFVSLVGLFQSGSSDAMATLDTKLQAGDLAAAGAICHKLASSAANVGALSFSKDMRQLERLCAAADLARVRPLFNRLHAAYPSLIVELSNLQRASA
jgi:two-component system sensor histidine kinase/response regulator